MTENTLGLERADGGVWRLAGRDAARFGLVNDYLGYLLLITLAETTPVLEAAELQADLERAGIHPWAWVVNNSVAAAAPTAPLLRRRAALELDQIDKVRTQLADRYAVIPLLAGEPIGIPALQSLAGPPRPAPVH